VEQIKDLRQILAAIEETQKIQAQHESLTTDLKRVFEILGEQADILAKKISLPKIIEIFEKAEAGTTPEGKKLLEKLNTELGS